MRFIILFPRFKTANQHNRGISRRRKGTVQKYDPPYSKKPPQKSYSGVSGNHHAEAAALDTVNKILTFGRMPQYRYDDHFVAYLASQQPNYREWFNAIEFRKFVTNGWIVQTITMEIEGDCEGWLISIQYIESAWKIRDVTRRANCRANCLLAWENLSIPVFCET